MAAKTSRRLRNALVVLLVLVALYAAYRYTPRPDAVYVDYGSNAAMVRLGVLLPPGREGFPGLGIRRLDLTFQGARPVLGVTDVELSSREFAGTVGLKQILKGAQLA